MGVDPKAKTMGEANGRPADRGRDRAKFVEALRPPDSQVGAALAVITELLVERHDADPRFPVAKLSVARVKGGDWVASANDSEGRVGISVFSPDFGAAVCMLASKLVAGEPWKALPDKWK